MSSPQSVYFQTSRDGVFYYFVLLKKMGLILPCEAAASITKYYIYIKNKQVKFAQRSTTPLHLNTLLDSERVCSRDRIPIAKLITLPHDVLANS